MGWSLVTKVAYERLSDPAGRNVSEACAGLESDNADADPPAIWGRPRDAGKQSTCAPARSALTIEIPLLFYKFSMYPCVCLSTPQETAAGALFRASAGVPG